MLTGDKLEVAKHVGVNSGLISKNMQIALLNQKSHNGILDQLDQVLEQLNNNF